VLQCFAHFQPYLKGREELVLTVHGGGCDAAQQPRIWELLQRR
jgi:hypothetical protein